MTRQYDDFLNLQCDTVIKDEKDGYYAFEKTVFYGEKGGALSDKGTINNSPVIDLKWENDILYHKIEEKLNNPIHLEVDIDTRYINTAVQSALHIMDGYYEKLGLRILAIGVHENNQWYEINSKEIDEHHLQEVQKFMNQVIRDNISSEFKYIKGSEYHDEKYQQFDEVRLVKFADLDCQPCGTLHLHNTAQIQSFVVLDYEKTSRGTRIYITCNLVTSLRLKQYHELLKNIGKKLNVGRHEIESNLESLITANKTMKKELETVKKELMKFKAQELLKNDENIICYETEDPNEIRFIAQEMLSKINSDKLIYAAINNDISFAILSVNDKARAYLEEIKKIVNVNGGGSLKIVTAKVNMNKEDFIELIKSLPINK